MPPPPTTTESTWASQPIAQQISLVEAMWERICARPTDVPVPPTHIAVVVQRLADHLADPTRAESMDAVLAQAEAKCQ